MITNNPYRVIQDPRADWDWYSHPDRPCKGDERYTDLIGVPRREREEMKRACMQCPVYYNCLDALMALIDEHGKWDIYGIQAGQEGNA